MHAQIIVLCKTSPQWYHVVTQRRAIPSLEVPGMQNKRNPVIVTPQPSPRHFSKRITAPMLHHPIVPGTALLQHPFHSRLCARSSGLAT